MTSGFVSIAAGVLPRGLQVERCPTTRPRPPKTALRGSAVDVPELIGEVFGGQIDALERKRFAINELLAEGRNPHGNMTYGEFDLELFRSLVEKTNPRDGDVFVDLGSGCGRLVVASWLMFQCWERCIGIEIRKFLADEATDKFGEVRTALRDRGAAEPTAEVVLEHGSFLDVPLDDATVIFCYCTTWESDGPILVKLTQELLRKLQTGCRIVTVDKQLSDAVDEHGRGFKLILEQTGPNRDTFDSVGYIWELTSGAGTTPPSQ